MLRGVGMLRLGWKGGTTGPYLGSGPVVQRPEFPAPHLPATHGLPQGGPPGASRPCDIHSSILRTGAADSNAQARPLWSPGVGAAPTSWWPSPSGPPASPSHLRSALKNILLSGTTQGHPPQPALDPEPIWEPTVLLTAMKQRRGLGQHPESPGRK